MFEKHVAGPAGGGIAECIPVLREIRRGVCVETKRTCLREVREIRVFGQSYRREKHPSFQWFEAQRAAAETAP